MEIHDLDLTNWCRMASKNESTLRSFMTGRTNSLRIDTIVALANAIGVKPSKLMGEEQEVSKDLVLAAQRAVFNYIESNNLIINRDRAFVAVAHLIQDVDSIEKLQSIDPKLIQKYFD